MALWHNIEGFAFGLRAVTEDDAVFIIQLRTHPDLSKYINRTSSDIGSQQQWIKAQRERKGDYYFVVYDLKTGNEHGLISLYEMDEALQTAEWGRWLMKIGSLGAVESAYLIYQFAFQHLKLNSVYCRTLISNQSVLSFHDNSGALRERIIERYTLINNVSYDAIEHKVDVKNYGQVINTLGHTVLRIAKLVV